jgi:hypothetical protein
MLRNYLYIDESKLDLLAQQIRTRRRETSKRQKTFKLSITGLGVELSEEDVWRELSTHERIEALIAYLAGADALETARPREVTPEEEGTGVPNGRSFVLETMLARRVIVPDALLRVAPGVKHLAVWISDPDPTLYTNEDYIWRGSFLYLTELWLDDGGASFWSGCSALQSIVNASQGKTLDSRYTSESWEPFGRGSYDHPVNKLASIGAVVGDQRHITSLYIKRFITNEQCYTWNGERRRVNDLLAYPVFIAAATQ